MKRTADLLGPSPYTGEQNDAEARNEGFRRDYTLAPDRPPEEYAWAMTPTHVTVSPDADEARQALRVDGDPSRPHAVGRLFLRDNWDAAWQLERSTMALHAVEKRLKRYTKDQGWSYDSLSDRDGHPVSTSRESAVPGIGEINPGLKDWRIDEWSGTGQYDNPGDAQSDAPFYGLQDPEEDFPMSAPRTCTECGFLAVDYDDWREHVMRRHVNPERKPSPVPQPVVDLDDVLPAGFNEVVMDRTVQRQSRLIHQLAAGSRKPTVPGPIPFIYDIEGDRIFVGQPGERHADIEGRFTPGGIVEGVYDPKGHVQIRTDTDMPYTVRHMVQLWYAMHPELIVSSIYLLVGEQRYKLASTNIGHKVRNLLPSDPAAYAAYHALKEVGEVYAVGGVVRDVVLGRPPKDIDLLVQGAEADAVAESLGQLPGRVDYTGKQFGVFRYRDPHGNEVEIAMPRTERSTGPGHKDFEVYTDPYIAVETDLARRDFTGNAMAVNLTTGELVDPFGGAGDLRRGRLRAVSERSLVEDPLRVLRALGSVSRHELTPDDSLRGQMALAAELIPELPAERVSAELDKAMSGSDPVAAFRLAQETGVLARVLPEVADTHGFDQRNKWHGLELFEHLMQVLGRAASQTDDVDVRWAALLHDIGKPASQWIGPDGWAHYYKSDDGQGEQHELVGADMSRALMQRLKFPNDRVDRVSTLVRWHMFPPFEALNGARKYINRVGDEHADDLLTLRWADSGGKDKGNPTDGQVSVMRDLVRQVRERKEPTTQAHLAINGSDLIQEGFKPGPEMGVLLRYLTELVVDDPTLNEREKLLQIARERGGQRTANILDPVQKTLSGDVFRHPASALPTVKEDVASWAREKVHNALRVGGWPDPAELDYVRLVLTGSLTTYQWSEDSDFDVSVWIDSETLPEWVRADLIALMVEQCDGILVPGSTHPLQCFVVDSEKYQMSDLYRTGLRSAWDLDRGQWIVPPDRSRAKDVRETNAGTIEYARGVEDKIRMMLRYGNDDALRIYWKFLKKQRQRDMAAGKGDFAPSNIVYKWLVKAGLLPHIAEALDMYIAT
jgi:tRNA nucleotidyltransferase (CCA-adding enzyme)